MNMRRPGRYGYGWVPDVPDHRDLLYADVAPMLNLPSKIDLRQYCPPVYDQGQLGSCTANALSGNLAVVMHKDLGHSVNFSRLFIYYNEREMEGTVNEDVGAMIRDGVKTLVSTGGCFEINWPYDIRAFTIKPDFGCYSQATHFRITSYRRLNHTNLNELKNCLAHGFAFTFGITVYTSFETAETAKTGMVSIPLRSEHSLGGHALCCVGYDDSIQAFLVRNSWGVHWGIGGYCWIPYAYMTNPNLSDDFWTLRAGTNI